MPNCLCGKIAASIPVARPATSGRAPGPENAAYRTKPIGAAESISGQSRLQLNLRFADLLPCFEDRCLDGIRRARIVKCPLKIILTGTRGRECLFFPEIEPPRYPWSISRQRPNSQRQPELSPPRREAREVRSLSVLRAFAVQSPIFPSKVFPHGHPVPEGRTYCRRFGLQGYAQRPERRNEFVAQVRGLRYLALGLDWRRLVFAANISIWLAIIGSQRLGGVERG
jgi:hypothetical protein